MATHAAPITVTTRGPTLTDPPCCFHKDEFQDSLARSAEIKNDEEDNRMAPEQYAFMQEEDNARVQVTRKADLAGWC